MSYEFEIEDGWKVKVRGRYPWPWRGNPGRTIELFPDDILTKGEGGYSKHNGLCCTGIKLTPDQVEPYGKKVRLSLI